MNQIKGILTIISAMATIVSIVQKMKSRKSNHA